MGKFAHEIGHIEDGRSRPQFFMLLEQYNKRVAGMGAKEAGEMARIHQEMFGADIDTISYDKEMRADRAAIPVLQEHFGKNIPKRVQKAIQDYKKAHP